MPTDVIDVLKVDFSTNPPTETITQEEREIIIVESAAEPTTIEMIEARFAEETVAGGLGLIIMPSVSMHGMSAVDMTGAPVDATEIIISFQGLSTAALGNIAFQAIRDDGNVHQSPGYFGATAHNSASSVTTAIWDGVGYCTVVSGAGASSFFSGMIRLTRVSATTGWHIQVFAYGGSRNIVGSGVVGTPNIIGGRLGIVGTTFDAGSATIAWRK